MYVETKGSRITYQGKNNNQEISKVKREIKGDWTKVARKIRRGALDWCYWSQRQQFSQKKEIANWVKCHRLVKYNVV